MSSACQCASCQRSFTVKAHHIRHEVKLPKLNEDHPLMPLIPEEFRDDILDSAEANEELTQMAAAVEDLRSATASHQAIVEEPEEVEEEFQEQQAPPPKLLTTPATETGTSLVDMEMALGDQAYDEVAAASFTGVKSKLPLPMIIGGVAAAIVITVGVILILQRSLEEDPQPPQQIVVDPPPENKKKPEKLKKPPLAIVNSTPLRHEPWQSIEATERFYPTNKKGGFLTVDSPMLNKGETGYYLTCHLNNKADNRIYPEAKVQIEVVDINQHVIAKRTVPFPMVAPAEKKPLKVALRSVDMKNMAYFYCRVNAGEAVRDFREIYGLKPVKVSQNGKQILKVEFKPEKYGVKGYANAIHLILVALDANQSIVNRWHVHDRGTFAANRKLSFGISVPSDSFHNTTDWRLTGVIVVSSKPLALK